MPYPTGTDVVAAVQAQGGDAPSGDRAEFLVAAAIAAFEQDTGRIPFEAPATPEARTFRHPVADSQGWYIPVRPFAVAVTEVRAGYRGPGTGTVLTLGEDALLEGTGEGVDFVHTIRLERPAFGPYLVTARWGSATELPIDAFEAVIAHAQAAWARQSGRDMTDIAQGPLKVSFGRGAAGSILATYDAAVRRYLVMI